jgi:hypothetical protein
MSMGWDFVFEMRPPMDLLFLPQVIYEYWMCMEWYWQGKTGELKRKTCPSATLSTTDPTWTDLGLCCETMATNPVIHGMAGQFLSNCHVLLLRPYNTCTRNYYYYYCCCCCNMIIIIIYFNMLNSTARGANYRVSTRKNIQGLFIKDWEWF